MRIPVNVIHWYIGSPFLLAIVIRSLMVRKKSQNTLNTLLLIATTLFLVTMTSMGFTSLFTADSQILTIGTMIGGVSEAIALFVIWIMVAHMYFPLSKTLRAALITIIAFVALGCSYVSITENIIQPTTLSVVDGSLRLIYPFSSTYQILIAILYLSFFFVATKFWRQSRDAATSAQSLRLKGLALGLFLIGSIFVALPFLDSSRPIATTESIIIAMGLVVMGSFLLGSFILSSRESA